MREIVHLQAGQCGNQIGAKVIENLPVLTFCKLHFSLILCCLSKYRWLLSVTSQISEGFYLFQLSNLSYTMNRNVLSLYFAVY